MPLKEAAAAVTARGREMNFICQRYVKEKYGGEIVYGDTDSIMITYTWSESTSNSLLG